MVSKSKLKKDLVYAYLSACKHKRRKKYVGEFLKNFEQNIDDLASELLDGSYEISPSICFIIESPIKREVIAADFRDRVVHHFLFNLINPVFERQFIYDSYSCRVGKGTLFGIERLEHFMRSVSCNYTKQTYVLKLDIQGFFMSIDRNILYKLVMEPLQKPLRNELADYRTIVEMLVHKIVYNNPLERTNFISHANAWDDLPKNKTLKHSPTNCGLPIGNLTSQLFGNIYLNPLDHFVKRDLKIKGYGRYVDDFFLIDGDVEKLLFAKERIREFLKQKLHLTLHPKKVYLQPIEHGVNFVGAYVLPHRKYLSKRIQGNYRNTMLTDLDSENLGEKIVSYLGQMEHFDCYRFLEKYYIKRGLLQNGKTNTPGSAGNFARVERA